MHVLRAVARFASKGFVGTIGSALWLAAQCWKRIWPNPSSLLQRLRLCYVVISFSYSRVDTLYFPATTKCWECWSWKFERMEGSNLDAHQCTVFPRAVLSEFKSECSIQVWTWTLLSRAFWTLREEVGWKSGSVSWEMVWGSKSDQDIELARKWGELLILPHIRIIYDILIHITY